MTASIRFDFTGTTVLLTGCAIGIGAAVARGFALAGADLWMLDAAPEVAETARRIGEETGTVPHALCCDISDAAAVTAALAPIPRIDALVNNAGYQPRTPMTPPTEAGDADFSRVIDVNVKGSYNVTRAALARIPAGGRIVFTSSIWGKTGAAGYAGYTASKHAVIGLARALAMDLGPRGISVNALCPGWVETEGAMWTMRDMAAETGRPLDDLVAEALAPQPLPGIMPTEAMVPHFLWLSSDAARDITGQAISIDRGSFIG